MKKNITKKIFFFILSFVVPLSTKAGQEYVTLSKTFPVTIDPTDSSGIYNLLNALLTISVGVAAVLAVIILTIGGFKYMTSESIFNIGGAKEQITNAIVGLLIVLTAILMLSIINPEIVKLKLFG